MKTSFELGGFSHGRTFILVCSRYKVTQVELFALLCRLADELLFRQIAWIKKLPFFCELSIKDYTCLLSSTWQELILLSCLTIYRAQIFGELANVTAKYTPTDDELQGWVGMRKCVSRVQWAPTPLRQNWCYWQCNYYPYCKVLRHWQVCVLSAAFVRTAWIWWRDWCTCSASSTSWRSVMRSMSVWRLSTFSTKVKMQTHKLFSWNYSLKNCGIF